MTSLAFSTKGRGRGLGAYSMRLLSERYLRGRVGWREFDLRRAVGRFGQREAVRVVREADLPPQRRPDIICANLLHEIAEQNLWLEQENIGI